MLLHIIHPQVYKQENDSFRIGPSDEFEERDRKVSALVSSALDSNAIVINNRYSNGKNIGSLKGLVALSSDSVFDSLFDPRLHHATTFSEGVPIPDEKPDGASPETWKHATEEFTSHTEMGKIVGKPKDTILIGGPLESSVVSVAEYFREHYLSERQRMFYIPELCVAQEDPLLSLDQIEARLDEAKARQISYADALEMARESTQ